MSTPDYNSYEYIMGQVGGNITHPGNNQELMQYLMGGGNPTGVASGIYSFAPAYTDQSAWTSTYTNPLGQTVNGGEVWSTVNNLMGNYQYGALPGESGIQGYYNQYTGQNSNNDYQIQYAQALEAQIEQAWEQGNLALGTNGMMTMGASGGVSTGQSAFAGWTGSGGVGYKQGASGTASMSQQQAPSTTTAATQQQVTMGGGLAPGSTATATSGLAPGTSGYTGGLLQAMTSINSLGAQAGLPTLAQTSKAAIVK